MASIEYGIDGHGRKVFAREAHKGRTYMCPYCHNEVHVCKGNIIKDYFAHNPIHNRTPQQMICPGYTGEGSYHKIEGKTDQIYITNGGLPLYLCEHLNGKYQLNAYYPPISNYSMSLLDEWNVKVEISENGKNEEYSASTIKYYRVKTTSNWIKIRCKNMRCVIEEVQQKWEWGIRGINCDLDIFHSNFGGGYRVALHSNIIVGKEYLIVTKSDSLLYIKGIIYTKKGTLVLNDLFSNKEFIVYSMVIIEVTDKTIAFIHNKGYQLIEESDEIIPLWPPAVIEGKELIYKRTYNRACLFHNKRSEQVLYVIDDNGLRSIGENDNIFLTKTSNNTILLSDCQFNSMSNEIRFMITQSRDNFNNNKYIVPVVSWIDDFGVKSQLSEDSLELYKQGKVQFDTNVDLTVCELSGNYLVKSTKRNIEKIYKNRRILISLEPFGKIEISKDKLNVKEILINNEILTFLLYEIYKCNSVKVPINQDFLDVYEYAKHNSTELYRIMGFWALNRKMPYRAVNYLKQIKEVINYE